MKRKMLLCVCCIGLIYLCGCNQQESQMNVQNERENVSQTTDQNENEAENEVENVSETELESDTETMDESATEQNLSSGESDGELAAIILESDCSDTDTFKDLYQRKGAQADALDFNGEWNRTNVVTGIAGSVWISNQDEEGFDFSGEFYYYSHSGEIEGRAYFVEEDLAIYQYEDEYADEEAEEEFIAFVRTDEGMEIRTTGSSWELGFGMNVFADGGYTLGEPEYTNANILAETFSEEELAKIEQMLGTEGYEEYFVFTVEYGAITTSDCIVEDGQEAVYYEAFLPTMGGYEFTMLICEDGSIYFYSGSDLGWQTNVSGAIDFPGYEMIEE